MKTSLNILFLCEGSQLAGVESYTYNLASELAGSDDVRLWCGLFYNGPLRDRLKHHLSVLDLCGKNNVRSIRFIRDTVRTNRIDLIHFIDLKSVVVGGIASLFLKNVKKVATVHGLPEAQHSLPGWIKFSISLFIYFVLLKFSIDRIICVSFDLKSKLRKIMRPEKLVVVHNGLVLKNNSANQWKGFRKRQYIFGTVGRLDKVKGLSILLESAQKIFDERKDVLLYVVGSGPLEHELKEKARRLGIADRIRFWGFREDALDLISGMDVFVLSSLHEGIPYALLEAMSLSKPVVCTNVGGIQEVVQDGIDGLLVSSNDHVALSSAILRLLHNREYAAELGRNARRKIEEHFSSSLMVAHTRSVYNRLLMRLPAGTESCGEPDAFA
jgi:L-malate glycosyltransferase